MWSLKCGSRRPMSIWNSWEFMSTISIMRPSQHIRWQKQQLCLAPNWDFVLWMGGRIRCVASVGQKWRNRVHTSREGGCEDKGDYEARMPSIIRRSTPLWVFTQQRLRHNGLVRGSFCSEDLQLLHKENSQIAISFWHVANQISDKDW